MHPHVSSHGYFGKNIADTLRPRFCGRHFQILLPTWNLLYFILNFTEIVPMGLTINTRRLTGRLNYSPHEKFEVKQFRLRDWPDADDTLRSTAGLLCVLEQAQAWVRGDGGGPIIVHCRSEGTWLCCWDCLKPLADWFISVNHYIKFGACSHFQNVRQYASFIFGTIIVTSIMYGRNHLLYL